MTESVQSTPERITLEREDDSVRIMQLVPDDAQAYYDLITYDLDHLRHYDDAIADKYPDTDAVAESIRHPSNPSMYRFGIWDGDTLVGGNNLRLKGDGRAELGFWVGKKHIGHGYAGRAQRLLTDFAFKTLELDELYCDIVVGNDASRKSAEKSGFRLSGQFVDEENTHMWRFILKRPAKE